MSDLCVIQTRDRNQRTIVSWYEDVHEAERSRPIAWVGAGQLHIDADAPAEVAHRAVNLFRDELVRDPFQDLGYLTTHRRDGDGYVLPVKGVPA